ncbi:hypothetical protein B0H17DRAFT_1150869 [Mycena rosella]|uniref:Uncharacterized protein n=1 Tax=Mycena rosella TaxID=1033263 RepID=A0AAD7BQF1_MYCRO|nr:hypothetical protein B0H17DRAFT_1150869 [Mycena rosella]
MTTWRISADAAWRSCTRTRDPSPLARWTRLSAMRGAWSGSARGSPLFRIPAAPFSYSVSTAVLARAAWYTNSRSKVGWGAGVAARVVGTQNINSRPSQSPEWCKGLISLDMLEGLEEPKDLNDVRDRRSGAELSQVERTARARYTRSGGAFTRKLRTAAGTGRND